MTTSDAPATPRLPLYPDLRDKVAIVTGASRGIGAAIARGLAASGARVVLSSRSAEALAGVVEAIRAAGGRAEAHAAHAGREAEIEALVAGAAERHGGLDLVVANAGTNPHYGPALSAEASHWDKTVEVNLKGPFFLARAAAPRLRARGGGAILFVASIAGLRAWDGLGVYSATKAGLLMLARVLAKELAPDRIRVNALAPGIVETKFSSALLSSPERRRSMLDAVPLGRVGEPDEIAGAALFLLSDAARFVTGETLVVDGGQLG